MTDQDKQVRPFADVLRELKKGEVHEELSQGLHQLISRVQELGKPGQLTLTIKVKNDRSGMLVVDDDVKLKLPDWQRQPTMWFVDDAGNLSRRDPNQLRFDGIKAVEKPADDDAGEQPTGPTSVAKEA